MWEKHFLHSPVTDVRSSIFFLLSYAAAEKGFLQRGNDFLKRKNHHYFCLTLLVRVQLLTIWLWATVLSVKCAFHCAVRMMSSGLTCMHEEKHWLWEFVSRLMVLCSYKYSYLAFDAHLADASSNAKVTNNTSYFFSRSSASWGTGG